ncbi:MAG: hypothetical protein EOO43_07855 [Flavobacterium sp.]|nr:MAG: hypothetical protein EOO43_07855 [Flavobacterium sp.]
MSHTYTPDFAIRSNIQILQLEKWKKELTITETYIEENETYKLIVGEKIAGYYSLLKVENETVKLDNLFLFIQHQSRMLRCCINSNSVTLNLFSS